MKDNKVKMIVIITLIAGVCIAGFVGAKVNGKINTLNEALNDANSRYEKLEDSYADLREDMEAKEELQTEEINRIEQEIKRKEEEKLQKEKERQEELARREEEFKESSKVEVILEEAPRVEEQIISDFTPSPEQMPAIDQIPV